MDLVERFINYTKFDTQSSEDSDSVPSTAKQLEFAKYLKHELEEEGLAWDGRYGLHLRYIERQYQEKDTYHRIYISHGHQSRCKWQRHQGTRHPQL